MQHHSYESPTANADVRFRYIERDTPASADGVAPDESPEPTNAATASFRVHEMRGKVRLPGRFGGLLIAAAAPVAIFKFAPQSLPPNWVGWICIASLLVCGGLAVYLHRKA